MAISALLDKPAAAHKAPSLAAEAANRWRRDIAGPADWLPDLADRMARLAALEKSFAETLENEKLAALAEFAAGAGHEINNPLTVIAGRANSSFARSPIPSAAAAWRDQRPGDAGL